MLHQILYCVYSSVSSFIFMIKAFGHIAVKLHVLTEVKNGYCRMLSIVYKNYDDDK